jgi:hypothetical protein
MGLAAIQYVTIPATFLASVQPMDDEVGQVYYRQLLATATRGNVTAGDEIMGQEGKMSWDLDGYYGEEVTKDTAIAGGTGSYAIALSAPVRPQTLKITITKTIAAVTTTYNGIDDGDGAIYGNWETAAAEDVTGTVNYETGAVVINLKDTEGGLSGNISILYHQNLAQATTMPGFQYKLASKQIRANYFILENQYSTLSDYAVRRRFGKALSDDIAASAVAQINSAVLASIIRKLRVAAISTGVANWDATPPAGTSVADHRKTFVDSIEAATQLIDAKTGRGAVSFIIAGSYGRRVLGTLGVELSRKPLNKMALSEEILIENRLNSGKAVWYDSRIATAA